ncbi:hypothetical protein ACP275_10G005700 [Erythranthe tilingii]
MGDLPDGGATAEPNPFGIGTENWAAADRATLEIIRKVQPTPVSEEKRKAVIYYIQRLIRNFLGAEVIPYGSVPLKTYLPDGDIDLTAFGGANFEDTLAGDMKSVLEEEEKNMGAEFVVKDVQLIRAEVKLVKCIIQDIVVDVSFNQIGGLCTLCFLEQVDRVIGRDHLFKRSIILIKAWCYYESRILGAHHGLISTYALETLVLYIFHHFHSTLDGPLAVLYKFLDYFSKFDWDTYCISLNGPIRLSSLPALIAEMPEDSDRDLLLSSDFLSSCVGMFSVPCRGNDKNSRGFQTKHLNIVDPLKESNNLGRSISKGNFYRIRSAFSYGARKLARILVQPDDSISVELHKFFSNTIARHGDGLRHDIHDFDLDPAIIYNSAIPVPTAPVPDSWLQRIENFELLNGAEKKIPDAPSIEPLDLAALKISDTPVAKPFFAPHLYFAESKLRNRNANSDKIDSSSFVLSESDEGFVDKDKNKDVFWATNHTNPGQGSSANRRETTESLSSLSDLTGDYETYLKFLQYGRWCYEYGLGIHSLPMPPPLPTTIPFQGNIFLDGIAPLSHYKQNGFSHRLHNGFLPIPPALYPVPPPVLMPGVTFGWDDASKARGTGTYFPNMNQPPLGYRSSSMNGRNQVAATRAPHMDGRSMIFMEGNMLDRSSNEVSQQNQVPIEKNVMSFSPHNGNGLYVQPEADIDECGLENSGPASSSPRTFSGMQRSQPAFSREQDRISLRSSYILKDEEDFPPLPV